MKCLLYTLFLLNSIYYSEEKITNRLKNDASTKQFKVNVNKCCEVNELYVGNTCVDYKETTEPIWKPQFINERGEISTKIIPEYVTGYPDCGPLQKWPVYHNQNSEDSLRLLPNGVLRHYVVHMIPGEGDEEEIELLNGKTQIYYDHNPGKYCLDKKVVDGFVSEFAWVCSPNHQLDWTASGFLTRNIISPVTHLITITCLLIIGIIYFIIPTLNDLSGNIITTICISLLISEAADLIRLLTVFKSHTSLLITGSICYFNMLAAFFWLTSLGFYIWKTFRSRNVFLRITDGKKYCYYACFVWGCAIVVSAIAIFSHYTMDYQSKPNSKFEQETDEIGSLGMVIFFVPIAFAISCNIFFLSTTVRVINKMHTYGRIHHKLRHSFRMFVLLLLVMSITWLFFLSTFSNLESLINSYIIINALQGPLFIYVCICNQKHVAYLLKKTCCYAMCSCKCCEPEPECEWGDEMTAMNTLFNS